MNKYKHQIHGSIAHDSNVSALTTRELHERVGGLSKPSKMPCHGYSIPASRCFTGSKLRLKAGSTCAKCYALKGRYVFKNVQEALERRYRAMVYDLDAWTANMVHLIARQEKTGFFRWHDSGDIQSTQHLHAIVRIALALPSIKFWLPTRELKMVRKYLEIDGMFIPSNLRIRVSSYFVGSRMKLPDELVDEGVTLSTVGFDDKRTYQCPANTQGNTCGACRACWSAGKHVVNYPLH